MAAFYYSVPFIEVNMNVKKMEAIRNATNGYDLMIERDAGNLIRILTGPEKISKPVWQRLRNLADQVLDEFENDDFKLATVNEALNHPNWKLKIEG
jgi:hypothetical protein